MVHFTSGSYFGPCEKTFSPFFRSFKKSKTRLWAVFRRRNVVMGIDVRWVSRGRRDVDFILFFI
jgi:hypothetical protein